MRLYRYHFEFVENPDFKKGSHETLRSRVRTSQLFRVWKWNPQIVQNGFVLVQNAGHAFAVAVGHVLAGMGTNQTYTHLQNPPQKVPDFILIWKKGIRLGLVWFDLINLYCLLRIHQVCQLKTIFWWLYIKAVELRVAKCNEASIIGKTITKNKFLLNYVSRIWISLTWLNLRQCVPLTVPIVPLKPRNFRKIREWDCYDKYRKYQNCSAISVFWK